MKLNLKILFTIVFAAVLIIAFNYLKPKPTEAPANGSQAQNSAQQAPLSTNKDFELTIVDGKIVSGPTVLNATQGDSISIKINSDVDEEFHLHAYDKIAELKAGKEATIDFVADLSGRFPFELEKSKIELGALEVEPK